MERAGSCDYGQLDTEARPQGNPKDNEEDAMDTKHLRCFQRGRAASYGVFSPPPEFQLGPMIF